MIQTQLSGVPMNILCCLKLIRFQFPAAVKRLKLLFRKVKASALLSLMRALKCRVSEILTSMSTLLQTFSNAGHFYLKARLSSQLRRAQGSICVH